jgi:hypothetical protein
VAVPQSVRGKLDGARLHAHHGLGAGADGEVEAARAELLVHHLVGDAHPEALGLVRQELPLDEPVEHALAQGAAMAGFSVAFCGTIWLANFRAET